MKSNIRKKPRAGASAANQAARA
jgi:hypothetical protein